MIDYDDLLKGGSFAHRIFNEEGKLISTVTAVFGPGQFTKEVVEQWEQVEFPGKKVYSEVERIYGPGLWNPDVT